MKKTGNKKSSVVKEWQDKIKKEEEEFLPANLTNAIDKHCPLPEELLGKDKYVYHAIEFLRKNNHEIWVFRNVIRGFYRNTTKPTVAYEYRIRRIDPPADYRRGANEYHHLSSPTKAFIFGLKDFVKNFLENI